MIEDQFGFVNASTRLVVWKLLQLRALIIINNFKRAKTRQKIGIGVFGLLLLSFMGFAFYASWMLLKGLRSPELAAIVGDVTPLVQSIPTLILSGTFVGILVTSFGVLLQALYLAGDMDFLLSAPIPIRAVFISKLLEAILPNFALICIFALPLLFGLGVTHAYSIIYYPLVILILMALALAAAGISSLFVMLAARILPARRMVEILGFIGAITSLVCSQSGQLARFEDFPAEQTGQMFKTLSKFHPAWSPLTWAGNSLVRIGEGDWSGGIAQLTLTLVLAFAIFGITLVAAERLYYSGWARIEVQKKKKNARGKNKIRQNPLVSIVERIIPAELRAIVIKDSLVLRRDLRALSQLITPLIFGVLWAFLFFRDQEKFPSDIPGSSGLWQTLEENISVYATVGLSLLVGWMLITRLGGIGFSQEGKHYWLLKSAPVRERTLIIAKFLVAYLPSLGLSSFFLIGISLLRADVLERLWFILPVVAICIAGNAGLSLAFGIIGANMSWEDPRQMQKTTSGCLGTILSMIYLPISLSLFFAPSVVAQLLVKPIWIGEILGLALGSAFSLTCAILPLWLARKAVARLGES